MSWWRAIIWGRVDRMTLVSWWRAIVWGRVDRIYLTLIFMGPKGVIHVVSNLALAVFFLLKNLCVINPPEWLSTLAVTLLMASVIYCLYLQHKIIARFQRGDTEARPPP